MSAEPTLPNDGICNCTCSQCGFADRIVPYTMHCFGPKCYQPTLPVSQPNVQQLKIDALSSIATLKIAVDDPSIADFIMHRVKTWVNAELAERDRELQQVKEWKHNALVAMDADKEVIDRLIRELQQAREELKELEALRAGARTVMLKLMLAGDVGCFADRMRQLLQAEDWDAMRLCISDFFNAACDITQSGREEMDRLTTQVDEVSKCHLEARRQSQLAWMRVAEHKVEAARIQDRAESAEQSLSEAREELARLKGLLAKFGHHDSDCNRYHGWNDKTCTCGFAEFEVIPEKPSYSESNGKVILTMSRKDYEYLIYFLKYAAGLTHRPTTEVIKLIDRLDSGNPNSYPVPEKPDTKGKS